MGAPFTTSLLMLTKVLSLDAVAMIQRESYFRLLSPHFPTICLKIQFFGPFWPFFIIYACLLAISLLHFCLYWKKVFTGCCCNGICKEKATSGYLHHIFPPFARKFHFFSVIGHFTPFVPTRGQPLHPTSAFIDETVITGCCCNDICKEKATPGYYHPILLPFSLNMQPFCFLALLSRFVFF